MQSVSGTYTTAAAASYRRPQYGVLISWKKTIATSFTFFQLDHSHLDRTDKLKGTGPTVSFFDKYDYVNESNYIASFDIVKKVSSRPWGVITAQATVTLNNASDRFTPGFDGTIGAYILRDRPIKLSVGFEGEFTNMFVGYTERPQVQVVNKQVVLQCFDAMAYLYKVKSALPTYVGATVKTIVTDLLLEQGFTSTQFNIEDSLQQPISYFNPNGKVVGKMLEDFCNAEGALMFVDEAGIIQFWNRLHMSRNQTVVSTFNYSSMRDVEWDSTSVLNDVKVVAKPLKTVGFNKIFEMANATTSTRVPAGGSVDIIATFADELGPFPALSITAPVDESVSIANSYYSSNYDMDSTGDSAVSVISLTSTFNFGDSYRMTFSNSSSLDAYIDKIVLFGTSARISALQTQAQIDTASIGLYGLNPDDGGEELEFEFDMIQDAATANTMAYLIIKYYANPLARMSVRTFARPQLQIGDPVSVTIAETSTTYTTFVMGYRLAMSKGAKLEQELYLEQRQLFSYFQLDISHIDRTDRLGP